jgi:hypothetical protein
LEKTSGRTEEEEEEEEEGATCCPFSARKEERSFSREPKKASSFCLMVSFFFVGCGDVGDVDNETAGVAVRCGAESGAVATGEGEGEFCGEALEGEAVGGGTPFFFLRPNMPRTFCNCCCFGCHHRPCY